MQGDWEFKVTLGLLVVVGSWYEMGIPGQHGLYEILSQKERENDIFVVTPN